LGKRKLSAADPPIRASKLPREALGLLLAPASDPLRAVRFTRFCHDEDPAARIHYVVITARNGIKWELSFKRWKNVSETLISVTEYLSRPLKPQHVERCVKHLSKSVGEYVTNRDLLEDCLLIDTYAIHNGATLCLTLV